MTPNGATVAVGNASSDTMSLIAASSDTVVATLPVGRNPFVAGNFIGPSPREHR